MVKWLNGEESEGFTLVELLVSVAILGFALIIIIQSYLGSLSGLDITRNYIAAMGFASNKLQDLQVSAYENNGLTADTQSGDATLGSRRFNWETRIIELEVPQAGEEDTPAASSITQLDTLENKMVEVCVGLNWQERNILKKITLATYLPKKQENEPAP